MFCLSLLSSKPKSHSLFSFALCRTSAAVRCLNTGSADAVSLHTFKNGLNKVKKKLSSSTNYKVLHQEIWCDELCEWSSSTGSLASFLGIRCSQLSQPGNYVFSLSHHGSSYIFMSYSLLSLVLLYPFRGRLRVTITAGSTPGERALYFIWGHFLSYSFINNF